MASAIVSLGYQVGSTATSKSYTKTGEGEQNLSFTLPSTTSPIEVAFTMTASMLKAFFLNSDYLAEMRTNSVGSPGDTFTLKAGKPLVWTDDFSLPTSLFTTTVTKLYFYNTSGTSSAVVGYSVYDAIPTP